VRIRIAKKQPEAADEDEENDEKKPVYVDEKDLEEIPIDDKCLTVTTHNEGMNIFVIN